MIMGGGEGEQSLMENDALEQASNHYASSSYLHGLFPLGAFDPNY